MHAPHDLGSRWHVVVPVRGTAPSKSRLDVPHHEREQLARAFARDTVDAALAATLVRRVVVVTAPAARSVFEERGATVVDDPSPVSLATAISAGLAICPTDAPCAVLLGDLPALDGASLDAALAAASGKERAVVPDAEGTGTTLLTAAAGIPHEPRFGRDSYSRHLEAGYFSLEALAPARVRADVDTLQDLKTAAALGLGKASRSVYLRLSSLTSAATQP